MNLNIEILEEYLHGLTNCSLENLVNSTVDKIKSICDSNNSINYHLTCISKCRFVNKTNEKYSNFPYWSFGTYSNVERNILIGYFYVKKKYGLTLIKDNKHKLACIVISSNDQNLESITNRFILIRKYHIFTEIFQEKSISPMEYIVFNIDDVITLDIENNETKHQIIYENVPENLCFKNNFKFIISNKSTVLTSIRKIPECWLEIFILEGEDITDSIFLVLDRTYLNILPFLQTNQTYEAHHNKDLKPYYWDEVRKLNKSSSFLLAEESAVFVKCKGEVDVTADINKNILTIKEAKKFVKISTKMCSFIGVLSIKEFAKAIESRTQKNSSLSIYGTRGSKTHVLHFLCNNLDTRVVVILNNWENLQVPFGLVPNMKLLVHNVMPQKKRYFKSTALTSFQILGYEPLVKFDTVNLCSENYAYYGKISFLGYADLIPQSVLIRARITEVEICTLHLISVCIMCNEITPCTCSSSAPKYSVSTLFYATDEMGQALVASRCLDLVRAFLKLNSYQWNKFLQAFKEIGEFSYSDPNIPKNDTNSLIVKLMRKRLDITSEITMTKLELYCRKLESKPNLDCRKPQWYCVGLKEY